MLSLCGYNMCFDKNALDIVPANVKDITSTKIQGGIFEHFNMSKDTTSPYSNDIPTAWDFFTILDCNFENSINAGNVQSYDNVTSIKIKRRIAGEYDWLTLAEISIKTSEDLKFNVKDYFNSNGLDYEYALVPIVNNVELNYIIEKVHSEFNGVFIADVNSIYEFYADVNYGSTTSVQKVGVFETIGSKYPIIVSNGNTDYHTGTISATILDKEFKNTRVINRDAIVKTQKMIDKFFKNKRAKILKDWNGNSWLVYFSGNPTLSYDNSYGMGVVSINGEWTEQGNPNNQADLYRNNLVKVVE